MADVSDHGSKSHYLLTLFEHDEDNKIYVAPQWVPMPMMLAEHALLYTQFTIENGEASFQQDINYVTR